MSACHRCESTKLTLMARRGSLETWKCESCGLEMTAHVLDPSVRPISVEPREPIVRLMGLWTTMPDGNKVTQLRSLAPRLRNRSDSELSRSFLSGIRFEIGRFNETEIRNQDLEGKLLALGLDVQREPVDGARSRSK
jgi:hypothetical protein